MNIWQTFPYPGIEDVESVSDEIILENVRIARNKRLAASDWTQLPDAACDQAAWAEYRQQLRDLPESGAPRDLVWPDAPAV